MKARIADIIAMASRFTGVSTDDIVGRSRNKRLVRVRAAVCLVARQYGHSYPAIGHRFGRDHSTIINYIQQENIWRAQSDDFGDLVDKLTEAAASPDTRFASDTTPVPFLIRPTRKSTWSKESAPEDFAEQAAVMGKHALRKHYRRSAPTINRWFEETGVIPFKPPHYQPVRKVVLTPAPADLRAKAATMCITALARHYGASRSLLDRWLKDEGITCAPYIPPRTSPSFSLAPTMGRGIQFGLTRASSVYDLAADDLRRDRWSVYRCDEHGIYAEKGGFWRVGNIVCDDDELLVRADKARRKAA